MGVKVANNAFGTLNAGITSSDTTIVLNAGEGARFPALTAGDYFFATLIDTTNNLEIVKATARATDTLTVVRGQDSTTARAFSTNDRFELRPTAALFNELISGSGGGATGGGTDKVFFENDQSVTTNYTLTANKNAMSAGPVSIGSGVTVTVPSGAVWTVV